MALNTEMVEKYFFIEHTEDYLNVFVWVAPGSHTLTNSIIHILRVVHKLYTFMHLILLNLNYGRYLKSVMAIGRQIMKISTKYTIYRATPRT